MVRTLKETPEEVIMGTGRGSQGQTEMARITRFERMREYFAERPKETILIRKDDGEQTVRINGYGFRIQAGQRVAVPVDVADVLRAAGVL